MRKLYTSLSFLINSVLFQWNNSLSLSLSLSLSRLTYTGLLGELEHLKIETRLIDEMFVSVVVCNESSVMGEYV